MNVKNSLPSAIYRMSVLNGNDDIARDNRVGIAIELSIDKIFMIMYCRRSFLNYKSTLPIRLAILSVGGLVNDVLKGVSLNTIENDVFEQLNALSNALLNNNIIPRSVLSIDTIEMLLNRITFSNTLIPDLIRLVKFVLAVANQIDYIDSSIVVPHIRILPCDAAYAKCTTTHELVFNRKRNDNQNAVNIWYNIFSGLRLNNVVNKGLVELCTTINIGTNPDVATGLGLTRFFYETYVSSDLTKRFVDQSNACICDESLIKANLINSDLWMAQENMQSVGSLEADNTDSVSKQDKDATADGGTTDDTKVDDTTVADADPASDKSTPADDDTAQDTDAGDSDPLKDMEAADNSDPAPEDEANVENDSSTDDLDNTDESKPILLGLNLTLPKNETLDHFMYKLSVARFVDTVIEFNHDELPLETVTILQKWKSMLLFLTDAEETKRLLKDLNIKLK